MLRILLGLVAALAAGPALADPASLALPVAQRDLPNGLRVLVHPDHAVPVISSYVFYRVGSRNERTNGTGLAHLFEHMMFNGGKKYGPGVFDDMIEGNGGSTNGYTTRDFTTYLNNFPREALDTVLDLEADRMWHLAITPENLKQERGIVMEERRLRIDNDVNGTMFEQLYLHAYERSPYRWNTIGFMADLELLTLAQARAFFDTYYAPDNAVLVLAGDLEPEEGFAAAARHFARIPRRPPPPPVSAAEPAQDGERDVVVRKHAELPALLIGWRTVNALHPDRAALDVAAKILTGGETATLTEDLVREHELVTTVGADLQWGIDPELFIVSAQARPGKTAAAVRERIDAVLAKVAATPPDADALATAKRQLRADFVKGLKTVSGKANQIGFFEVVLGDHRRLDRLLDEWDAVTAQDVQRVVQTYLSPTRRTVVELEPLPPDGGQPGAGR